MEKHDYLPLFETKPMKGRLLFRLYTASVFLGICFICAFRVSHFPTEGKVERWGWIGLIVAELWFSFYGFLTIVVRWNPVSRRTFKDRLSHRYEKNLPGVDIFICTADPTAEPPSLVINTALSLMAYDYPPDKLNIYLSDDGGSELTFYAMLEASRFCKIWLPFCRKFKVEPRSPAAYFGSAVEPLDDPLNYKEWLSVKKSFEDMMMRIHTTTKVGKISKDIRKQHKGFREWDVVSSRRDHQTILQILIDGRDPGAVDVEGEHLPTLVYLAREKRPQYHHNFKAGAMNALIRVSSKISNSPIIMNVDCDMYSNNSGCVRDAMCFFMDEEKGHEIAYVQYPQHFHNLKKNDIYASSFLVELELEMLGVDGNGGPCYLGTGCFHRRDALCGKRYCKELKINRAEVNDKTKIEESAVVIEETCKVLASCTYEQNKQWGKEMGLKYGFPVEDGITGLSIQCKGWRSVYTNPERKGFTGLGPTTLLQTLIQQKRWSEGHLQAFLSKYCPLLYGHKKIPLKLQLSYCPHNMWAANSLPTLYIVAVPSLCLLRGISLFPKISSPWVIPFVYAVFAQRAYSLGEFLWLGGTLKGWCNLQRIWVFKRTTSYLFGFFDTILKLFGFSEQVFALTAKVADEDVSERYEREVMEFGASSPMFSIIATLALLNLFCLVGSALKKVIVKDTDMVEVLDQFGLQILGCCLLVMINLPVYQALFFRRDNGRLPPSTTYQSMIIALLACAIALY
ncbi:hypothetical protein SLE2022_368200 [Rubroshorea leprosula]